MGHWWNARVWAECRTYAAAYLREVGSWFPAAAAPAERLAGAYEHIATQLGAAADRELPPQRKRRLISNAAAAESSTADSLAEILEMLPD